MSSSRQVLAVICSIREKGDEVNAQTIAARFDMTPEEAERIMDIILGVHVDDTSYLGIYPDDHEEGSFWASSAAVPPNRTLRLTPSETAAVQCALEWMETPADDPLARQIEDALGARDFNGEAVSRMLAPLGTSIAEGVRASCARAIAAGSELRFGYQKSGSAKVETRRVRPQRLTQSDGAWHLEAFDLDRSQGRTFRLDRMSEVESVVAGSREDGEAEGGPMSPSTEPRQVTLTFDDAHWLELLPWHDLETRRKKNGAIEAKTSWYGGTWLPRMIAACGGHVTCGDPALMAAVRGVAAAALAQQ